jgi:serine/threonine protein kinase
MAAAAHPTDRTLRSYGLGKLDDALSESVSKHLEVCASCQRRVAELSSDSFLGRLRGAHGSPEMSATNRAQSGGQHTDAGQAVALGCAPADEFPLELVDHPTYEIVRELGRGGMGVVYLARNKLMGRLEVLKVVGAHLVERPGVRDRFLREVQSAAKLHHKNIVTAFSALRLGESIILAMEYVDGDDLAKMVKSKGPLPLVHACYFIHQAALGLQHAHECGMVHRDIKPANLIVATEGTKRVVKVLDFGLAKVTSEGQADSGLTREGQMLGTPEYIAPEQIRDAQSADIRADIYSLGCTLYYLLTGGPPFRGEHLWDVYQAHFSMDAGPLNLVRPEVPVELAAVVSKMMAKEPGRRFQTPGEVAQALTPFFKPGANLGPRPSPEISRVGQAASFPQPVGGGSAPAQPATLGTAQAPAPRGPSKPNPEGVAWESLIEFKETEESIVRTKPKPAPKPKHVAEPAIGEAPVHRPPWRSWRIVAAASVLGAFFLGVIIFVTNNGRIKIVVHGPRPIVTIDGETIRIEGLDEPMTLRAGPHELAVKWGDGEFKTRTFVVRRGENEELPIEYELKPRPDKAPVPSRVESLSRTITDNLLVIRTNNNDIIGNAQQNFLIGIDRNIKATLRNDKVYINEVFGRKNVLCTAPLSPSVPGIIDFSRITKDRVGTVILFVHAYPGHASQRIVVKADDVIKNDTTVPFGYGWKRIEVPFRRNQVRLEHYAEGWWMEFLFIDYEVVPDSGPATSAAPAPVTVTLRDAEKPEITSEASFTTTTTPETTSGGASHNPSSSPIGKAQAIRREAWSGTAGKRCFTRATASYRSTGSGRPIAVCGYFRRPLIPLLSSAAPCGL